MRKLILYIVVILLSICTYLSVSYAYYTVTPSNTDNIATNVITTASCLTISTSQNVTVSGDHAIPVADLKALNSDDFKTVVTINNNCSTTKYVNLGLALGSQNSIPASLIRYAIYQTSKPTSGILLSTNGVYLSQEIINDVYLATGDTVTDAYNVKTGITLAANSSQTFNLYVWIYTSASNSYMNKKISLHTILTSVNDGNDLNYYLSYLSTGSGTDAVATQPWKRLSNRAEEFRYAGRNPNNYISFNNELWRIVGVMPNMEYCDGEYTDTTCTSTKVGNLVKIVRNDTNGQAVWNSSANNSWVSSTLKNVLQSATYASDSHVAVVKWSLYGTNSISSAAQASASAYYNKERNIDSLGSVYTDRPTYWYGKVGLLYPSDYAYATNGDNKTSGNYTRANCLEASLSAWTGSLFTYCAKNDWLYYAGITSTAPSTGVNQWLLTPYSANGSDVIYQNGGVLTSITANAPSPVVEARPVVYLKPDTLVNGSHTGTYSDPYQIQ